MGKSKQVEYDGVYFSDPFDKVVYHWHRPWTDDTPMAARTGKTKAFTFYVTTPRLDPDDASRFRVDTAKMKDCIAPRLVHSLDAMFNGMMVELISCVSDPVKTRLIAVHDAWLVAGPDMPAWVTDVLGIDQGGSMVRQMVKLASWRWFEALEPVYDDLAFYLDGTKYGKFIRDARVRWQRRKDACSAPISEAARQAFLARLPDLNTAEETDEALHATCPVWPPEFRLG